ncbi:MAG TPA: hypothetical protein VGU66_20390 [Candidatus Elarobacter sp.]|nr:hypothetical protein [Candidatus Elarobacter sp.]
MNASFVRTALVAAALLLLPAVTSGCSSSVWIVPDGVMTTPADRGKVVLDGIYPNTTADDGSCCWVQRRSRFLVKKAEAATDLAIEIYLPDFAVFRAHRQAMDVTLDGTYRFHKCCYSPGTHTALFPLPRKLQESTQPIEVAMTFSESFVPAKLKVSPDQRPLAAVLVAVELREL